MIRLSAVDREGGEHQVLGQLGESLMQALRGAGLDIPAICGGSCTCATCHVYVAPEWCSRLAGATEEERELLSYEAQQVTEHSRLSCQILLAEHLDGLRLTLGPLP